jgi:hypothetical protein
MARKAIYSSNNYIYCLQVDTHKCSILEAATHPRKKPAPKRLYSKTYSSKKQFNQLEPIVASGWQ